VDAVDPNEDRDIDDDEAALAAYNRMLSRLHSRDSEDEGPAGRAGRA
jgi:hypothetical protein